MVFIVLPHQWSGVRRSVLFIFYTQAGRNRTSISINYGVHHAPPRATRGDIRHSGLGPDGSKYQRTPGLRWYDALGTRLQGNIKMGRGFKV